MTGINLEANTLGEISGLTGSDLGTGATQIQWDASDVDPSVVYVEVYANKGSDVRSSATLVGSTTSSSFVHSIDAADLEEPYYYWVRGVTAAGVKGDWPSSGMQVYASNGIAKVTIGNISDATYTLVFLDMGRMNICDYSTGSPFDGSPVPTGSPQGTVQITVPPNTSVGFPTGAQILFTQGTHAQVQFIEGSGVTIVTAETLNLRKINSIGALTKISTDTWFLSGDLESA